MKYSNTQLVLMTSAIILGSIFHFTGAATWLMTQANPGLKALSTLGHVFGYIGWAFSVSGNLQPPLDSIVLVILLCAGAAVAGAIILAIYLIKEEICNSLGL